MGAAAAPLLGRGFFPSPDDLRSEFYRWVPEGAYTLSVIVHWRHIPTGTVIWMPDPSYRPLDPKAWLRVDPRLEEPNLGAGEIRPYMSDLPRMDEQPLDSDDTLPGDEEPVISDPPPKEPPLAESGGFELDPAAHERHGFKIYLDEGLVGIAVTVFWRHLVTGEVVEAPSPSWGPTDPENWESLGSSFPFDFEVDPPILVQPPVYEQPPGGDGTRPGQGEPVISDPPPKVPPSPGPEGLDRDPPDYERHGFKSNLPDDMAVMQVVVFWRHLVTGEIVWAPDPSWGPPDPENWEVAYDPGAFESEPPVPVLPPVDMEPPSDDDTPPGKDGPVDGEPPPSNDTEPRPTDPVAADLELVAYHWKSRAVIEKTAWRVAEDVESLVGQPLPKLFRPVLEETTDGGRVLGVRMSVRGGDATGPGTDPSVSRVDDPGVADQVATTPDAAAVNLRDAVAILRMIAGKPVGGDAPASSPFQSIAADFDGDGVVGLGDALGVLRHAVGRSGAAPAWAYVDDADPTLAGRAGLNPGLLPQEQPARLSEAKGKVGLVGVLRGDVDGSWAPPPSAERLADAWFDDHSRRVIAPQADHGFDPAQWGVYPG